MYMSGLHMCGHHVCLWCLRRHIGSPAVEVIDNCESPQLLEPEPGSAGTVNVHMSAPSL